MSAISRHQPLIIFDIDQSGDQSCKSEIKKGILVFELPGILWSIGFDDKKEIGDKKYTFIHF